MKPSLLKKVIPAFLTATLGFSLSANAHEDVSDVDDLAREYVQLSLAMGQHDKAFVDAYYGPEKWAKQASQEKLSLDKILARTQALLVALEGVHPPRDAMARLRIEGLKKQTIAMALRAKMSSGKKVTFEQQTGLLYDSMPAQYDFEEFDTVLAEIEKLVPGDEPLYKRIEAFTSRFEIPKDKLSKVFEAAIAECKRRTEPYIELADNERFTVEYVSDKPWSGYNWYKGDAYSVIQVNTDFPVYITRAVDLGCHEGYPGHHVFNALLEKNLSKKRGWVEFTVYPLFSPQSLIAEGSANYGIELAFPGDDKLKFEKEVLFPLAGLDPKTADDLEKLSSLQSKLAFVNNEIARRYINGTITREQAVALGQKYRITNKDKADQGIRFIEAYGAYVINYNWGKKLVKDYIEGDGKRTEAEKWAKFAELLSSPGIPSKLK